MSERLTNPQLKMTFAGESDVLRALKNRLNILTAKQKSSSSYQEEDNREFSQQVQRRLSTKKVLLEE